MERRDRISSPGELRSLAINLISPFTLEIVTILRGTCGMEDGAQDLIQGDPK